MVLSGIDTQGRRLRACACLRFIDLALTSSSDILSSPTLVGLLVSVGAGIARGFSGFGFSALTVAGVSLVMAPSEIIPAVLVLEVIASLSVWRAAVRDLDMAWLKALITGNLICIPMGAYLLAQLDPLYMRLLVGSALLVTAAFLRWRSARALKATQVLKSATGAISGFLNGLAASGGVAAALMMAATHVPAARLRGTVIVFLVFGSSYTLLWVSLFSMQAGASVEVFSLATLLWIFTLAPGMLLGMSVGKRAFQIASPVHFRLLVLDLLILISALGSARAVQELLAS